MAWVINQLIAFLVDLKSTPFVAQLLTLAGIPSVVIGYPVWAMTRKVRHSVTRYEALEQSLATALREATKLEAERDALQRKTPEAFLASYSREMKADNNESAMALAETFLGRQKEALLLAFRTRMDEAVGQSVDDGAPAFAMARSWALAALALAPGDRTLEMLIDELVEAEAITASGARARLKSDSDRKARATREDRLPTDLDALAAAFFAARNRGHYALILFLAGHGLILTRRRPFGVGSRQHLIFRRHRVEALNLVGRSTDALAEAEPLGLDFESTFGDRAPEALYTRYLIAQCRKDTGDAAGALAELEALLPLYTKVQGARHPGVLMTRGLIAQCRNDTGDAAGALAELKALLPLYTEVQGARHPHVLTTRSLIAQCRNDTGDAAGALAELEALLPLYTEVQGARHPHVLDTRTLRAACLLDVDDYEEAAAETDGVREGLVAAGLRPEHRFFRRLARVEERLRRS